MYWLCRRSLNNRGRLDAVYEKSIMAVININPLMCHHVECERSGEWLKCRGLAVTICLFNKIKCMFPMVDFFMYTFMCLFFVLFSFCMSSSVSGTCFIFILQYMPLSILHLFCLLLFVWVLSLGLCIEIASIMNKLCVLQIVHFLPSVYFSYDMCILSVLLCLSYWCCASGAIYWIIHTSCDVYEVLALQILFMRQCLCFAVICGLYMSCCV